MWQKTQSIWKYIALHYVDDYDWFLLGGDDMYYIMENLYEFLNSDEIAAAHSIRQEPLYLGRNFHFREYSLDYNTGGPGYLLNSHAVKVRFCSLS
jgi:glycoprotein-N-acetylgalactosamine 3-beta-galactosyltransferase